MTNVNYSQPNLNTPYKKSMFQPQLDNIFNIQIPISQVIAEVVRFDIPTMYKNWNFIYIHRDSDGLHNDIAYHRSICDARIY